jgi:tetratricopeptide (TPR) repeat protein
MLRDAGLFDEAIAEYRKGLEYASDRGDLLAGLLETLLRAKRFEDALAETNRAFEAKMDSSSLRRAHAIALCQLARYEEAERSAASALDKYPDLMEMHQVLGYACAQRGELDAAIAHLQRSLAALPHDRDARLGLARVLVNAGRPAEALAQLDILALDMQDRAEWHRQRGLALLALTRYDDAIESLEGSFSLAPPDGPGIRALASALVGLERYTAAVDRLHAFYEANPRAILVANDLAWLLATCPDESIRDGDEALKIAEVITQRREARVAAMLDTLAAALAEVGRFDDAVRVIDEAIAHARDSKADPKKLEQYEKRRALYMSGKPYRTEPTTTAPAP